MFKFKNTLLEKAFVLSPFFWSWAIVFNVPNSKHVLSRLIAIVCVYLIIAYKGELKENFKIKHKRVYVSILLLSFLYYVFLHVYNDGHFDFARVLITTGIFIFLVPRHFFVWNSFAFMIFFSSAIMVVFGLYEKYFLGADRIGGLVNSGPYAFVCGLLLISLVYLLSYKRKSVYWVFSFLAPGLLYIVFLTGTRTSWLSLSVCFFLIFTYQVLKLKSQYKYFILFFLPVIFYSISTIEKVNERIKNTNYEVSKMVSNSDYISSAGARLDMWRNGVSFWSSSPIYGVNRSTEYYLIEDSFQKGKMQWLARYHLTRTDRSSYHNVYVQSLVKGGIIGLLGMVIMIITPLLVCSYYIRHFVFYITLYVMISANFESQFTIYSSCAYFYILLMGFVIHIGHEQNV